MPYSVNGTGITFEPATKHVHYSNEPVLALCYSIELDSPLSAAHPIDEAVVAGKGGYQGAVEPDQLFGGPALSQQAGNITLRDARGNVADALNYGLVVDPFLAEGYQADSGLEEPGNFAPVPYPGRRFGAPAGAVAPLSAGRFPDGADADDNKNDFRVQQAFSLALEAKAGESNVKLSSIQGVREGAPIVIGSGADAEVVNVVKVGSAGGTLLTEAARAGAKTLVVAAAQGFAVGQEILVGTEEAVVAEVIVPRRWWGPAGAQDNKLVLKTPLRKPHKASEPVSGTGVTLSAPLKAAYGPGAPVATGRPTPGAANAY